MRAPQASFPSTQKTLRDISPVAAEARRLEKVLHDNRRQTERREALRASVQHREQFLEQLKAAGLTVSAVRVPQTNGHTPEVHEDLFEKDDGGKLVESLVRVPVFTAEQVETVYKIAEANQLGVMTLGAKTSALGVFAAWNSAKLHGLRGAICLEMPASWLADQPGSQAMGKPGMPKLRNGVELTSPKDLLDIAGIDPDREEVVCSENLPIAVVKDKSGQRHRVIAHATVTVSQINQFLYEVLPKDAHYQILPDLTSKEQAALGGVIATGAQGGNRASARVDLLKCTVVDALGKRELVGKDAKNIVGYNGYLGTCVQAEFEVTPFPRHAFGFIVPISGKTIGDSWQNALKLQSDLARHCVQPSQLSWQPDGFQNTMISSMEILGYEQLRLGIEKKGGRSEELKVLLERFPEARMFVYVTGSTHLDSEGTLDFEALLKDPVFAQSLQTTTGIGDSPIDALDEQQFLRLQEVQQLPHAGVYPLLDPDMLKEVDVIRHSAPEVARAEAEKIGNVTQSTDFNIQFTGPAEDQARARQKVAKLFADYQEKFVGGPYRIDVYGHLYPGMVDSPDGGGMDPHVRITLDLSDPDTRNDSPERVNEMKSILSKLYDSLLRLHDVDGIVVAPPEKSHLTNLSYVKWVRLHNPAELARLQHKFLGKLTDAQRNQRMLGGFRVPIEFPMEPRRGIRSFFPQHLLPTGDKVQDLDAYAPAIVEISQLSHRGPEIKGMLREVVASLREKLRLHAFRQHPFFIESIEEGRRIIQRNLGDQNSFKVVEVTSPVDFSQVEEGTFEPNTFYLIPAEMLGGIPGMCIMITPHKSVLEAAKRKGNKTNKEEFRNLVEMFHLYPYETSETPNLPAIAALGVALQLDELAKQSGNAAQRRIVTINPGPTQIHAQIKKVAQEKGFLQSLTSEDQAKDTEAFRTFLRMPEDMKLGFTGSATQCMQLLGEAMAQQKDRFHAVQVVNGAFSERMNKILKSHGLEVSTLKTPWTTSENSQVEFVANELIRRLEEGREKGKMPVLFVTPHKTATTAHFHPEALIRQLSLRGLQVDRDYQLVCDVTSGAGAIDYFTGPCEKGMSVFGSIQKALGCPSGLGFMGLSASFAEALSPPGSVSGLTSSLEKTEKGQIVNPFGLRMLGEKCRYELEQDRTVNDIHQETRQKVHTVLGFMALHPDLCHQVPSGEDQSPLLVGLYSITQNLAVASRLMEEIFGFHIGSGYGPFAQESLRLYLPTVSSEDLDKILSALHVVLQMPEVTQTVNPKAPIVSLREPHDPLQVLEHLVTSKITPDDIFKNNLGLGWLRRLQYTLQLGAKTPYGSSENFDEIRAILSCKLDAGDSLLDTYTILEAKMNQLERILLEGNEVELTTVDALIESMYSQLNEIVLILRKYSKYAPRTRDGRIKWPLAATPEQLINGNHANGNGNGNGNGTH